MTIVKNLNDEALVAKLKKLVGDEKKNIAAQVALLREVKIRDLALKLGFPSLKAFCEKELELTEDQAWKRSQAAGAVDKAPDLFAMLVEGQTTVSALAAVASKISDQTKDEITEFIPRKSKKQMEAFASTLRRDGSRIDKPQTVRRSFDLTLKTHDKLKHAARLLRQNQPELSEGDVLDAALELLLERRDPVRKAQRAKARAGKRAGTKIRPAAPARGQKGRRFSLTNDCHSLGPKDELETADAEIPAEQSTAPGRSSNRYVPGHDCHSLGTKDKLEAAAPDKEVKQTHPPAPGRFSKRYIPAEIRHSVYAENEVRCAFVGNTGKQCDERQGLHVDHRIPFAYGGTHDPANLRLLCPAHNRHIAPPRTG